MTDLTAESVKSFLLKKYEPALLEHGLSSDKVPDDFDFFAEGIVDSLGVLNMITAVENEFNISLDMEEMDADQLTVLGSFSRYAAQNGKPRASQPNGNAMAEANGLEPERISSDLRDYIRRQYSIAPDDREFTDDVHLYNAGYVDPFTIGDLRSFIESKFAIKLDAGDHATFPLNTIRELASFVTRRKRGEI